jgi:thymidylate synthase (FAD)
MGYLATRRCDIAEEWCPITFEYYNEHMKNRKNRLAP